MTDNEAKQVLEKMLEQLDAMPVNTATALMWAALKTAIDRYEPIPVDTKIIGLPEGDKEVWCCLDCRMVLDPNFTYCPHCGALLSWDKYLD